MQKFKGNAACVELCKKGKLSTDKTPEIMTDVATAEWRAFEYMNNGSIIKELVHLGALDPKLQAESGRRQISQLHEYLDMKGLKKQFQPAPTA